MKLNTIYNKDCLEGMSGMSDKSVDITFTSPPYNRIRNDKYSHYNDNNLNYMELLVSFTEQALRVTKGYVIVNLQQNHFNKKEYFGYLGHFANKINGVITWEKSNPQPATNYREATDDYSITNAVEHFIVLKDGGAFRANNKVKNIITTNVNVNRKYKSHGAIMKKRSL